MIKCFDIFIFCLFSSLLSAAPLWEDEFYKKYAYVFVATFFDSPVYKSKGEAAIDNLKAFINQFSSEFSFDRLRHSQKEQVSTDKFFELFQRTSEIELYKMGLYYCLNNSCDRHVNFIKKLDLFNDRWQLTREELKAARLFLKLSKSGGIEKYFMAQYWDEEQRAFAEEVLFLLDSEPTMREKIASFVFWDGTFLTPEEMERTKMPPQESCELSSEYCAII